MTGAWRVQEMIDICGFAAAVAPLYGLTIPPSSPITDDGDRHRSASSASPRPHFPSPSGPGTLARARRATAGCGSPRRRPAHRARHQAPFERAAAAPTAPPTVLLLIAARLGGSRRPSQCPAVSATGSTAWPRRRRGWRSARPCRPGARRQQRAIIAPTADLDLRSAAPFPPGRRASAADAAPPVRPDSVYYKLIRPERRPTLGDQRRPARRRRAGVSAERPPAYDSTKCPPTPCGGRRSRAATGRVAAKRPTYAYYVRPASWRCIPMRPGLARPPRSLRLFRLARRSAPERVPRLSSSVFTTDVRARSIRLRRRLGLRIANVNTALRGESRGVRRREGYRGGLESGSTPGGLLRRATHR